MKHTGIPVLLLSLLFMVAHDATAQPFVIDHYTTEQGLPTDYIVDILEDRRGFIWLSTQAGLCRFDGIRFKTYFYDPHNAHSPLGDGGGELYEDRNGYIWYVVQANGLNRYDPRSDTFTRFPNPPTNQKELQVGFTMCEDRLGDLYMMSEKGLCKYDSIAQEIRLITFSNDSVILPALTFKIFFNRDNRLFLCTRKGVFEVNLQRESISLLEGTDAFGASAISICEDARGHLLIGTWGGGLIDYDLGTHQLHRYGEYDENYWIFGDIHIQQSKGQEVVWGASIGPNILKVDLSTGNFSEFDLTSSFPGYRDVFSITKVLVDRHQALWFGTSYGIMKIDPLRQLFSMTSVDNRIDAEWFTEVTAVMQDPLDTTGNSYWYGVSQGGIFRYHEAYGTSESLALPPGMLHEFFPTKILRRNANEVWIGSNKGLLRYDESTGGLRVFTAKEKTAGTLQANFISDLEVDRLGRLWVGTHKDGLYLYVDSCACFRRVPALRQDVGSGVLLSENINDLHLAPDGFLWIVRGFDGPEKITGVTRMDPSNFDMQHLYRHPEVLPRFPAERDVFCILEDDKERVWIGYESGLFSFPKAISKKNETYTRLSLIDKLNSNFIFSIEKHGEHLWLAGNNGLTVVDASSASVVRSYTQKDGLRDNRVACMERGTLGNILLGVSMGFQQISADAIRPNKKMPAVFITAVKVLDKEYREQGITALFSESITLRHNQDKITFEFISLNLTNPENNVYAYMLEGVDEEWTYTHANSVNYNNLKGGNYVFRVKASNDNGVWNSTGDLMYITIIPPWYATTWFYIGCIVLSILLLYIAYRIRLAQILRIERLRQKISRDLHDDVGSSLSSINMLSALARKKAADDSMQAEEVLKKINETAGRTMENMSDIVWAINPANDTLADIRTRMLEFLSDTLEAKNIRYTFQIADAILQTKIPLSVRRDFYLFFKEAINNLAKHSEATMATITVKTVGQKLFLEVADNGKGFNPKELTSGNGLRNCQSRAEAMGATCQIHAEPGQGSRIVLIVPLN